MTDMAMQEPTMKASRVCMVVVRGILFLPRKGEVAAGRREGWQVGKDPKMQASLYLFPPPGGDALHPAQANQWQAGKSEPVKG